MVLGRRALGEVHDGRRVLLLRGLGIERREVRLRAARDVLLLLVVVACAVVGVHRHLVSSLGKAGQLLAQFEARLVVRHGVLLVAVHRRRHPSLDVGRALVALGRVERGVDDDRSVVHGVVFRGLLSAHLDGHHGCVEVGYGLLRLCRAIGLRVVSRLGLVEEGLGLADGHLVGRRVVCDGAGEAAKRNLEVRVRQRSRLDILHRLLKGHEGCVRVGRALGFRNRGGKGVDFRPARVVREEGLCLRNGERNHLGKNRLVLGTERKRGAAGPEAAVLIGADLVGDANPHRPVRHQSIHPRGILSCGERGRRLGRLVDVVGRAGGYLRLVGVDVGIGLGTRLVFLRIVGSRTERGLEVELIEAVLEPGQGLVDIAHHVVGRHHGECGRVAVGPRGADDRGPSARLRELRILEEGRAVVAVGHVGCQGHLQQVADVFRLRRNLRGRQQAVLKDVHGAAVAVEATLGGSVVDEVVAQDVGRRVGVRKRRQLGFGVVAHVLVLSVRAGAFRHGHRGGVEGGERIGCRSGGRRAGEGGLRGQIGGEKGLLAVDGAFGDEGFVVHVARNGCLGYVPVCFRRVAQVVEADIVEANPVRALGPDVKTDFKGVAGDDGIDVRRLFHVDLGCIDWRAVAARIKVGPARHVGKRQGIEVVDARGKACCRGRDLADGESVPVPVLIVVARGGVIGGVVAVGGLLVGGACRRRPAAVIRVVEVGGDAQERKDFHRAGDGRDVQLGLEDGLPEGGSRAVERIERAARVAVDAFRTGQSCRIDRVAAGLGNDLAEGHGRVVPLDGGHMGGIVLGRHEIPDGMGLRQLLSRILARVAKIDAGVVLCRNDAKVRVRVVRRIDHLVLVGNANLVRPVALRLEREALVVGRGARRLVHPKVLGVVVCEIEAGDLALHAALLDVVCDEIGLSVPSDIAALELLDVHLVPGGRADACPRAPLVGADKIGVRPLVVKV